MEGLSVLDMIQMGWYVTYPLIIMSMVCITIIFERIFALRGLIGDSLEVAGTLVGQLRSGNVEAALSTARDNAEKPAGRVPSEDCRCEMKRFRGDLAWVRRVLLTLDLCAPWAVLLVFVSL
mgnify:CR=1 FL=1